MKCPSCGLENIPGRTRCGVCNTSLEASPELEATLPPRAKNRRTRQRARLVAETPVRLQRAAARARERVPRLRPEGFGLRSIPMLLAAAIPGYGPLLLQKRGRDWLVTVALSVGCFIVGVVFYKTMLLDRILAGLVILSIISVAVTLHKMMVAIEDEQLMRMRFLVVMLVVIAVYSSLGSLVFFLLPVGGSMGIQASPFRLPHYSLTGSPGALHRGDLVQYDSGDGSVEAIVVAFPNETVTVFEPITVNGRPIALRPRLAAPYEGAFEPVTIKVPPGRLWVFPTYYGTPTPDMLAEAGLIDRSRVNGRATVILTPPQYRRILRPGSIDIFAEEGKPN